MNNEILLLLLPLTIVLVGVVTFLTYLFISSSAKFYIKVIGIPLILFAIYFSTTFSLNMLGRAYLGYPPNGFSLISYVVAVDKDHTKKIQLWARLKDGSTRVYQFPYSKQVEQELNRSMQRRKKGIRQRGEWSGEDSKHRNKEFSSDMTLLMYDIQVKRTPPKTPAVVEP